jgi:hypothetical protein
MVSKDFSHFGQAIAATPLYFPRDLRVHFLAVCCE